MIRESLRNRTQHLLFLYPIIRDPILRYQILRYLIIRYPIKPDELLLQTQVTARKRKSTEGMCEKVFVWWSPNPSSYVTKNIFQELHFCRWIDPWLGSGFCESFCRSNLRILLTWFSCSRYIWKCVTHQCRNYSRFCAWKRTPRWCYGKRFCLTL